MSNDWERHEPRSTARRLVTAAVVVAAAALAAAAVLPGDAPPVVPVAVETPEASIDAFRPAAPTPRGRWTVMDGGTLSPRARPVAVWTGDEMIVWGGVSFAANELLRSGAAFDPVRNRWRPIAPAPIQGRVDAASLWTGQELLVWGGATLRANAVLADGAAYDPATDRWRRLPPAPLSPRKATHAVWTGAAAVLWGGHAGDGVTLADGARYDPETDRWSRLPDSPLEDHRASAVSVVGVDGEVVVLSSSPTAAAALRYDVGSDTWHDLPAPPLDTAETQAFAVVGGEILGWGRSGLGDAGPLAVRYTGQGVWTTTAGRPPYAPGGGARLLATDDGATSWTRSIQSGRGLAYDGDTQRWHAMATPPQPVPVGWPVQVWADGRLVVWYPTASPDARNRTVVWTPGP